MQVLQQQQLLQSAGGVTNLSSVLQNTAGEAALLVASTVQNCMLRLQAIGLHKTGSKEHRSLVQSSLT